MIVKCTGKILANKEKLFMVVNVATGNIKVAIGTKNLLTDRVIKMRLIREKLNRLFITLIRSS